MVKNIWKKIVAVTLAAMMVLPSAAYAKTQTISSALEKTITLSAKNEDPDSAGLGKKDDNADSAGLGKKDDNADPAGLGKKDDNADPAGLGKKDDNVDPAAKEDENPWLTALRATAGIVIDVIEGEGLLDNELTSEGYDNLRDIVDKITDPEALKEALPMVADGALAVVMRVALSILTPYFVEAAEFLDSIGIGSDEIIELAGLIPEKYKPIVDEVLAYLGVMGITDPYDTVYPLVYEGINSTWAIYIYAAGNDLESRSWAASHDLEEIMQTSLPENVKVVIEGGGASYWHNDYMDSEYQNRCVYDSEGMHVISQTPRQNMGEQKTLEGFLDWCTGEYPADNTILVFWGHGAATDGACLDENYDNDALTLTEIENAVNNVFGKERKEPVFDVVGFDACLMAAAETASVCGKFASYLAASEETEPGNGWAYHSILAQISATPQLTMEQLGNLLCTSYLFNNEIGETDSECTFSYVDLKKANALIEAYDDLGKAILDRYREDPSIKEDVFHLAADAEAYGAMFGIRICNQIDLGDFASCLQPLFPEESEKVLDTLGECVLYVDNGPKRDHSRGLSCTFPFALSGDSLDFYKAAAASGSFLTYFEEAGYFADAEEESEKK